MITENLPTFLAPIKETPFGTVAYSYGPTGLNSILRSGQYFTTKWACELTDFGYTIRSVEATEILKKSTTGAFYNWFSRSNYGSDITRFGNISFSFDVSGSPLFTVVDNNNNNIILNYLKTGLLQTFNFSGNSPALFNTVQINFPTRIPHYDFPYWASGDVICFYSNKNNLNYRLHSEAWTGEYTILSGVNFENNQLEVNTNLIPNTNIYGPNPYRYTVGYLDKTESAAYFYTTKSFESGLVYTDMKSISTGIINQYWETGNLGFMWGNIQRNSKLGISLCPIFNNDKYIYPVLGGTGYRFTGISIINNYSQINLSLTTIDYSNYYFYTFSNYNTGSILTLNAFNKNGDVSPSLIGYARNYSSYIYDDFDVYKEGGIRYLYYNINVGDARKGISYTFKP